MKMEKQSAITFEKCRNCKKQIDLKFVDKEGYEYCSLNCFRKYMDKHDN